MTTSIVFETHSLSVDNDHGLASGWNHSALSDRGRALALELGDRRRHDDIDVVACSDLHRAAETAQIAFAGTDTPILYDWHLRECDYGDLNGAPVAAVHGTELGVDERYPHGESWSEAVARVEGALRDLASRWPGGRVLVIAHMSAHRALERLVHGLAIDESAAAFVWQLGWEYELDV